jgi:hypothetical protein
MLCADFYLSLFGKGIGVATDCQPIRTESRIISRHNIGAGIHHYIVDVNPI